MASPTVASVTSTSFNADTTSHACNLPATVDAGDVLLIVFGMSNVDFLANAMTAPSGFTEKFDDQWDDSGERQGIGVFAKVADGTEDGGTADVVTGTATAGSAQVYRIQGAGSTVAAVEVSAKAEGDSANANPPAHTPTGGSLEYLWLVAGCKDDTTTGASAAPTNFTNLTNTNGTGSFASALFTARRALEASTLDPGTFTSAAEKWITVTISVEPAADAGVTGTIAVTQAGDTGAIAGSFGPSGTIAEIQAAQTMTASGTAVPPPITGTMAASQADQTSTVTGAFGPTGAIAEIQASQTMTAAGTAGAEGSIAVVQAENTMTAAGIVINPVTGTLATTQADQTGSLTGGLFEILARTVGQFQRLSNRLHLTPTKAGIKRGFKLTEGWERVSDQFIYDGALGSIGDQEAAQIAVAAAWVAHAGSDAATLKTAIHAALDGYGYRRPDGSRLV